MYTLLLSFLFGAVVGTALGLTGGASVAWSIFWGLLAAAAAYAGAAFYFRRALGRRMAAIQNLMLEGQKKIQSRVKLYEMRPTGDPRQLMREMETSMAKVLRSALDQSATLEPFVGWVPLMRRQIATMRMQFHYQLKEFDKVDELLPRCLLLDPLSLSMKLAQLYRRKTPADAIRKEFDKAIPRFKYNQSVLPYSLMAWIYVQEKRDGDAHEILVKACKDNEHDTLKRNREKLANQRVREFSNAGLADQWYALYLETPKMQTRRVMPRADGRPF
jgi:tetratricopeptide (TPR) repeat protein